MQTIKTISLWQPWASFITDEFKIYETRSWATKHRGLLAIHAAKTWNGELKSTTETLVRHYPLDLGEYAAKELPFGAVLGICRLIHCYPVEEIRDDLLPLERAVGGYDDGRFAWQLQLLEVFEQPIPATGSQGLWDWTPPAGFFNNRVAVIGSRNFPEPDAIDRYIQTLPDNTIVISGGADGADSIAEYSARQRGLKVISIPVLKEEWDLHKNQNGKSAAGMIRNSAIVDMAGTVVAFHSNNSSGTADTIKKAHAVGKTVIVNPHQQSQSHTGESESRHNRDEVLPIAQEMARTLSIACDQLQIAGSIRRQKSDVKDAELVAIAKVIDGQNALHWVLDKLLVEGTIEKALYGAKETTRWGDKYRGFMYQGIKFEIFITQPHSFGYQYWLRTGPGDANTYFMKLCKFKKAPFHVKDGQVWWNDTALDIPDEATWFKLLGINALSPNQRSVQTYTRIFEEQPHKWADPKDFVPKPKQLRLGGEFNIYDEGALIAYLEKKEKLKPLSSKDERAFEWSKPWLHPNGKQVIVFNGWKDGERNYALAPIDSPIAKQHARTIMGCNYMTETEALQDWLDEQAGWRPVPFDVVDTGDWSMQYTLRGKDAVQETVPITSIIFTQETYHMHHVRKYWRNPTLLDEDEHLPFGVRFAGNNSVYLLDGTHRLLGRIWRGCDTLLMDVCTFPVTVEQASSRIDMSDGSARLEFMADVLEEAYQILKEAKEYA